MAESEAAETETLETETADSTEDITSLSEVFDDSETETEEVEVKEEKGEISKVPVTEEESKEEPPSSEAGLKAALAAERRKRQDLEASLRKQETMPDPIEDPEGYANYLESRTSQNGVSLRISLSRGLIMDQKEDYLEKEQVFMSMVADESGDILDETLHRKFLSADNPALFAYNAAKEYLEVQELKSPEYRERLKAELMEELKKELGKGKRSVGLPDLTSVAASGKNTEDAPKLAETIDEMFSEEDEL